MFTSLRLSRASLRSLFPCLTAIGLTLLGRSSEAAEAFTPLPPEQVAGNVGIFIGVGRFQDPENNLAGPPNDAATLAQVFVNELKLIPPERAFVVLSGELTPQSAGYLEALRRAGTTVGQSATKAQILAAIGRAVALPARDNAIVFLTISTHGCEIDGDPYLLPEDDASLINLKTEVRETLRRFSGAARQIVISDACRNERGGGSGARSIGTRAPLTRASLTRAAMSGLQADVLVGACASGQISLDSPEHQMGVFTKTLIDTLRGQGIAPDSEYLTVGQVLTVVSVQSERAAGDMVRRNPQAARLQQRVAELGLPRPWFQGELSALNLPLARLTGHQSAQSIAARKAAEVARRLEETVRRQPSVFTPADRPVAARLLTALANPPVGNDALFVAELDLALDPTSTTKSREVLGLVRQFAEREDRRARIVARLEQIQRDSSALEAANAGAWKRLREAVLSQAPSGAQAFFKELEPQLNAADAKQPQVLTWWNGWDRDRRRTLLLDRVAQAKNRCAPTVEGHLEDFLDLTQRLRTEQAGADALFDELEVRLDPNNCTFVEATLSWWNDRVFEERRQRVTRTLSQAATAHPAVVRAYGPALPSLRDAVDRWAASRLRDLLAALESRLAPAADADGFEALLSWWVDLQRQARRTRALAALDQGLTAASPSSADAALLRHLSSTLAKASGARLDGLLEELDRRLDPFEPGSVSATCAWWSAYRLIERRESALELVSSSRRSVAAVGAAPLLNQLTNAISTLPAAEVEPLLDQIEQHLAPGKPDTLRTVSAWYERNFLQPPTWDLYVAAPAGTQSSQQAAELSDAIVKQLRSRFRAARINPGPSLPEVKDEAAVSPLCRRLSAKAVLLVRVLSQETRQGQSASLGSTVTAEFVLEATAVRPGCPLTPRQYRAEYKDVASRRDAALRAALGRAVGSLASDADLATDLGL